jgi:Mn2+/Fe2+ NRAMP family transporter
MQNIIAMIGISSGERGAHWWDAMFLIFGIVMLFPVTFLTEIGERIGWQIGWRHIIWLEVIVIGLIVVAMLFLKRAYPELHWFEPIGGIFFAALIRGIVWFSNRSVDDDG